MTFRIDTKRWSANRKKNAMLNMDSFPRTCKACGTSKPITDFYKNGEKYRKHICKECTKAAAIEVRKNGTARDTGTVENG